MRNFIVGFVLGAVLFGSAVAYASWMRIQLIDGSENAFGTAEHPIVIQSN